MTPTLDFSCLLAALGAATAAFVIGWRSRLPARHREILRGRAQFVDAQQLAHIGSWELDLVENRITWSDETYRIFGYEPQSRPATFETLRNGVAIRPLGTTRDLTEQKAAERAFDLARAQRSALLDNLPDLVFLKDRDLRFVAVNEPLARVMGVPAAASFTARAPGLAWPPCTAS